MVYLAVGQESHRRELSASDAHHSVAADARRHAARDALSGRGARSALAGIVLAPSVHLAVVRQSEAVVVTARHLIYQLVIMVHS